MNQVTDFTAILFFPNQGSILFHKHQRLYLSEVCVCVSVCVCCPDGVKTGQTQSGDVSEKQLLKVAKRLGKEWKQVAIHLNLNSSQLDDIQAAEKDVTMQKLKMLVLWKSRRRQGEATVRHLWQDLQDMDDLPNDIYQTLQGKKVQAFSACKYRHKDDMLEFIRAKMIT